jgi:sugar phosphate isomerase/epimerase
MNREQFIKSLGLVAVGSTFGSTLLSACGGKSSSHKTVGSDLKKELFFKISLAEWSLHKMLFEGKLDHLDFALKAKNDFGITAVEYVNQFFKDKAQDQTYLGEMKKRCDDNGVTSVLIMIDGEGNLGETDEKKRIEAVENHKKWVEAAKFLGCHSIRVNAHGEGSAEDVASAATDGLRSLSTFAKDFNINVIVENHGGYSSNGQWLSSVIKATENANCGTLPDFGNFCLHRKGGQQWGTPCIEWYDRYKGTEEMMPFARGVSAKAHDFDKNGNCVETDFPTIMAIVKAAGYTGYVGIEYEGEKLSEEEGIRATKALLERVGASIG